MKIIMPCGLTIESSIELELSTPMQICGICENSDCDKRLGNRTILKRVTKATLPKPNEGEQVTKA